jgi:hypothetical protein
MCAMRTPYRVRHLRQPFGVVITERDAEEAGRLQNWRHCTPHCLAPEPVSRPANPETSQHVALLIKNWRREASCAFQDFLITFGVPARPRELKIAPQPLGIGRRFRR